MSNWLNQITNPKIITTIFGNNIPELMGVELHDIVFNRDGPTVVLRIDFANFPEKPPAKWLAQGFNCVQMQLALIAVKNTSFIRWGSHGKVDLHFKNANEHIFVTANGLETEFAITSMFATIIKVEGYTNRSEP